MATQRQPISRQEIDRGVQLIKANVLAGILGPERIEQLDHWIKKQEDPSLDRNEALRRLVDIGLGPHLAL